MASQSRILGVGDGWRVAAYSRVAFASIRGADDSLSWMMMGALGTTIVVAAWRPALEAVRGDLVVLLPED